MKFAIQTWVAFGCLGFMALSAQAGSEGGVEKIIRRPAGNSVLTPGARTLESTLSEGPAWYSNSKAIVPVERKSKSSKGGLRVEPSDSNSPAHQKNPYLK